MSSLFSPRALLVLNRTACYLVFSFYRTGCPDNCLFPVLCYKEQSGTTELWKSLGLDVWSKTSFKIMIFLSVAKADCRILVGQGKGKEQAWSRPNVRSGGVRKSWEARDCPAGCPAFTVFLSHASCVLCRAAWKELSQVVFRAA